LTAAAEAAVAADFSGLPCGDDSDLACTLPIMVIGLLASTCIGFTSKGVTASEATSNGATNFSGPVCVNAFDRACKLTVMVDRMPKGLEGSIGMLMSPCGAILDRLFLLPSYWN
jgi:hypothetical protein